MEFALQATPVPTKDAEPPIPPLMNTSYVTAGSATGRLGSIYCVQCGTKYARTDDACPNCGQQIQEPIDAKSPAELRLLRRHLQPIGGYWLIIGSILMPIGFMCLFGGPAIADEFFRRQRDMRILIAIFGIGMGISIELVALACFIRWLYQAWRLVLRGDEDYSPGLLVGLLFVPFFNLYWMFRVVPGLSFEVNQQLKHLGPARAYANGWGAGVAACILAVFPPAWPVAICMFLAWAFLTNHAINRLVRFHEQRRDQAERAEDERS